jgi:acetylornithine deacetylase/succinyl-diaminopimelate desuccinylase-like protein
VSPHEAIDRDFDAHLERIRDFLRIPSVSAHDGDLRSTADAVCELIEFAGGTAAPREPGEKRPTVIGVIDGPGPTVLRYGMYDVQPPGAQWTVAPFAAELIDGRIIARGAANSKGALAASILAFASAPSPCRQVFVCEGEEELGSSRLQAFCDAHRDELAADFALDVDLQEQPGSVFAGVLGLYEIELAAGGGPDVHSSRVHEVPAPAIDLARAVVAIKEAVPAANVTWMVAGTPEDVSRTVVAGTARAGIDLRFAQEDGQLDRVRAAVPAGVRFELKGTYPPALADPNAPPVRALAEALRRHGTEPRVQPRAPWWAPYHVFGDIPFASGGPGGGGGAHGPDEWAEVDGLRALMHVIHDALAALCLGGLDAPRQSQVARPDAARR